MSTENWSICWYYVMRCVFLFKPLSDFLTLSDKALQLTKKKNNIIALTWQKHEKRVTFLLLDGIMGISFCTLSIGMHWYSSRACVSFLLLGRGKSSSSLQGSTNVTLRCHGLSCSLGWQGKCLCNFRWWWKQFLY